MSAASAAFTAAEAIEAGEWDDHIGQLQGALYRRQTVLRDSSKPPPRPAGMADHQHWVWMNGPGQPHWEIRGTGALL